MLDDDERDRRMYGRGGGFAGSVGEVTGEAACSGAPSSKVSLSALGGGRSTMASSNLENNSKIYHTDGKGGMPRTSRLSSSLSYSPSISSGVSSTAPFRNTSPSSATQLFELLITI